MVRVFAFVKTAVLIWLETPGTFGTPPWDTSWDTYGTTHYYYVVTRGDAWDTLGTLMGQLGAKKGGF